MNTQISTLFDDESVVPLDQQESEEDVRPTNTNDAVLFNTDWTVETIFRQIEKGNINLDPQFQRREAWDIERKSKFIESILCSLPIPNVVLAEEKGVKGRYIVIDGKQRLFSIASYLKGEFALKGLTIRSELNTLKHHDLVEQRLPDVDTIDNYPIRTVIIRNWPDEDYLYTVFFRLNSGSLPLSPQELRKALHGGRLLDHIDNFIRNSDEFKAIFGDKLDPRMRDVEIALRFVAFDQFYAEYKGDLKAFLDKAVKYFDTDWEAKLTSLTESLNRLTTALTATRAIFGEYAFRKWNGENYERRANRAVFDVMTRYFSDQTVAQKAIEEAPKVVAAFQALCAENAAFRDSVERTTKSNTATNTRHVLWGWVLSEALAARLDNNQMRVILT